MPLLTSFNLETTKLEIARALKKKYDAVPSLDGGGILTFFLLKRSWQSWTELAANHRGGNTSGEGKGPPVGFESMRSQN